MENKFPLRNLEYLKDSCEGKYYKDSGKKKIHLFYPPYRLEGFLFLDEGFDTLDEETLEIALNALDYLQHQGKMIGIISHVEILKERIPTQIHIQKLSGGFSTLVKI